MKREHWACVSAKVSFSIETDIYYFRWLHFVVILQGLENIGLKKMAKKKLSKQEKKKAEAEQAEILRIEIEKERQKQLEEERERKILELQQAKERQKREKQENKIRRVQLAESCDHFQKIRIEVSEIYAEMRKLREWKRYMRCNGLPNAYDPGDLRKYLHMWCLENEKCNADEQNWLLKTNERTILTQNRLIANTSRFNLQQQQTNLGDIYAKRGREILGILDEIHEAITDPFTLKETIIKDLHRLKFEFREKLAEHIDEFSFKILSNIERDMTLDGLLIATHLYQSEVFRSHLWTKRDIPQPQLNEKEQIKEAKRYIAIDFVTMRLNLCLPPSVKCKNGAIRGMWLNFDHFSDYCPSFRITKTFVRNLDISIAARKEWKKRKELMKSTMIDETNEKDNNGAVPFDNFELANTTIVDVDKLYTDYMDEICKKRRKCHGPDSLDLKEFEINLRRYRIIGGVYCVEYFEQPEQDTKLSSNSFLRTISGSNCLKRKQFFQYYRTPAPVPAGVRRLPEEVDAEMKAIERGLSKLAYITIALPDEFMWFEPPTVCRWETIEETKISEKFENKRAESIQIQDSTRSKIHKTERSEKVIEDFDMLNIPSGVDLDCIMKEFVAPRLPNGYTIKVKEKLTRRKSSVMQIIELNDVSKVECIVSKSIKHIKEVLLPTNSPRSLHPKVVIKRPLRIIEKQTDTTLGDTPNVVYMFSKLLQDLDELCDKQMPYVEKHMEEISDLLSMSVLEEPEDVDVESVRNFSDISFLRSAGDYPWNLQKKEEAIEESQPLEDDESEEDSIEIDDDEIGDDFSSSLSDVQNVIGRWSIRDVHDSKFNEDKLAIQFRSGRLGQFGLAVNWYCNLPYQTWELKPDTKTSGTIFFSLTAAVVSIDITITADGVLLSSFQGGVSSIVQDAVGKMSSFDELKCTLMRAGINLFPDDDAFCYCETICEKDIVMESHLYTCMAYLALTHNFMWSRWNIQLNSRSAVLLMREIIEQKKPANFSTLLVTPLKALLVESNEVSTNFNSNPLPEMNFYADLYNLSKDYSHPMSIEKQCAMDSLLRDNVIQVLRATRPLSFC